jgi:glycerol uptake facilitator-like aquaporin
LRFLLPVEKLDCGLDELLVMLEDAAVPGVGVDDELDVRQATVEVDRVLGGHHPVTIAVGDQRELPDDGQVRGRLESPAVDALELGVVAGEEIALSLLGAHLLSVHVRGSPGLWLGEVVATFGLLLVIFGVVRGGRATAAPFAVGAYITGAYFFTSSTSFANPAVTVARTLSDTFAGIAPTSVAPFVVAQLVGAALACGSIRFLWPRVANAADEMLIPHEQEHEQGVRVG